MTLERVFIPTPFLSFYSLLSIKLVSFGGFYNTLGNLIYSHNTGNSNNSFEKFWKKVGKDLWMTLHGLWFHVQQERCGERIPQWSRLAGRTCDQRTPSSWRTAPPQEGPGAGEECEGFLPRRKRSSTDNVWWTDGHPHSLSPWAPVKEQGQELRVKLRSRNREVRGRWI